MTAYQRTVLREMEHYNVMFEAGFREAARSCRALVRMGLADETAPGRFWITCAGGVRLNP